MTRHGSSFAGHPFHVAAITQNDVGVVVNNCMTRFVEASGQVCFGDRETDGIPDTLTEGAGGYFYTGGFKVLGVTGGFAAPLAELFKVIQRKVITRQVQQGILQHATMTRREDKAIAIGPLRGLGVELHERLKEHIGHRCGAHGQTRVTRVRFLHSIHSEKTNRINS